MLLLPLPLRFRPSTSQPRSSSSKLYGFTRTCKSDQFFFKWTIRNRQGRKRVATSRLSLAGCTQGQLSATHPRIIKIDENKPSRTKIATLALEQGSKTVYENLRIFGGEFWPTRRVRETGCKLRSPEVPPRPPWSVNSALQHSSTPGKAKIARSPYTSFSRNAFPNNHPNHACKYPNATISPCFMS